MQTESTSNFGLVERKIIGLLLKHPDLVDESLELRISPEFFNTQWRELVEHIMDNHFESKGKRSLTRDSYETLVKRQYPDNRYMALLKTYNECCFVEVDTNDFRVLFDELLNSYAARELNSKLSDLETKKKRMGCFKAVSLLAEDLLAITSSPVASRTAIVTVADDVKEFVAEMKEMRDNPQLVFDCGIRGFDDAMVTGFAPGTLTLIVADVAMHKTNTMLNIGLGVAERHNAKVLFVPLEMPKNRVVRRIHSNRSGVPGALLAKPGHMSTDEWKRINDYLGAVADPSNEHALRNFAIADCDERMSVVQIKILIERHVRKFKPDMVVIDYIANMKPDARYRDRNDLEIGNILKDLRFLGRQHDFAVLSAAQMGREAIKRFRKDEWGNVGSEDIRGSHEYSADADYIFGLLRIPDEPGRIRVHVVKSREGPSGHNFELSIDPMCSRICDIEQSLDTNTDEDFNLEDDIPEMNSSTPVVDDSIFDMQTTSEFD